MNKILIGLTICLLLITLSCGLDKSHCKCRLKVDKKIVGGKISTPGKFPWQISISRTPQVPKAIRKFIPDIIKASWHSCGATILNGWVMTAGHCVEKIFLFGNRTYVGAGNDLSKIFDDGRIDAKRSIQFPGYKKQTLKDDIALVELSKPLQFGENVQPACIEKLPAEKYDLGLIITGFGVTSKAYINPKDPTKDKMGEPSRYLKEANMLDKSNDDIESSKFCKKNKGVICLLPKTGKDSACFGDSGGPAHAVKNGKVYVVGVASGIDQAEEEGDYLVVCTGPGIYTRVGYYYNFIKQHIGEDNLC